MIANDELQAYMCKKQGYKWDNICDSCTANTKDRYGVDYCAFDLVGLCYDEWYNETQKQ